MIMDAGLILADAVAFTAAQRTAVGDSITSDIYDARKPGSAYNDLKYYLKIKVTTVTGIASEEVFVIESSNDEAFNSSADDPLVSVHVALAPDEVVAGAIVVKTGQLPFGMKRYTRVRFTGEGTDYVSAGVLTAALVRDVSMGDPVAAHTGF